MNFHRNQELFWFLFLCKILRKSSFTQYFKNHWKRNLLNNTHDKSKGTYGMSKRYLEFVGFSFPEKGIRFEKRLIIDQILSFLYTLISVIVIIKQKADFIVFGLNILCIFRALINSTISASEVTIRIKKASIEKKCIQNSHYHIKAVALSCISTFSAIIWLILIYEENKSLLIKFISCISIIIVFLDDLEKNFVCAYGAIIAPYY